MSADNFYRNRYTGTGFEAKCRTCRNEKAVVPKGFKVCGGGCGKVLEEDANNFPLSKVSKTGFSNYCKSCYDARYGKEDVPDGHQRCIGKCGQVLKLSEKNFTRNKTTRSGFDPKCRSCTNAEDRAKKDAARGDKPKKRVRPKEDLPDGHQRCMGECDRVLEMSVENFHRNKNVRSGFFSICKVCDNARRKARRAAKKRAREEPEHVVEVPHGLPGYDDDEGVISD